MFNSILTIIINVIKYHSLVRRILPLFGLFLFLWSSTPALAAGEIPLSLWSPEKTDMFVVDVSQNTGYLVHENGSFLSFPVATGRKSYVSYIGRYYRAETPIRTWTAEQKQIKGDRRTFGVSGRFIRLFRDGENSPYGIHSYFKVADWMKEDERYFSMGCIVVTEELMDVIERTYDMTGEKMTVITTNAIQQTLQAVASKGNGQKS